MSKPPNIWGSEKNQRYRESFNGIVEVEAKIHQNELRLKPQFQGIEEFVFRAELETLMNEFKQRQIVQAIDYRDGDKARWFGEFVKQDRGYVLGELRKRLASVNIHPDNEQLTLYLKNVSKVIRAKLANGENVSSIPFTGENYSRKRGRPPKPKKRHHKRPILHKGRIYDSIADAARDDPMTSYETLKKAEYRKMEKQLREHSEGLQTVATIDLSALGLGTVTIRDFDPDKQL